MEEAAFKEALAALGLTVEAFIVRSGRSWYPDMYCYRLLRGTEQVHVGSEVWGPNTFENVYLIAGGE